MGKSNFEIADFMRRNQRSMPYGVSENQFYQKVRNVMIRDKDLTLSAAITLVQAKSGTYNNPH
tara:strand:+ start:67 stop:255 length:189 start_codon:yes stop_codon:yes gene_type:complete